MKKKSSIWASNDFQHVCFYVIHEEAIIYSFYLFDKIDVIFQVVDGNQNGTSQEFLPLLYSL